MTERTILATAPLRGPGLDDLRGLGEVVLDPWIDHQPLRLYGAAQLAERVAAVGASVLICEADECGGAVLDLPLEAIGSTRGDPTNVDVAGATARGIPVLRAPGRNADAVAELTVGLLLAATRGIVAADRDVRAGAVYRDGSIPYQRFRGWQLAGRTAGIVGLGAVGRATAWRLAGLGMEVLTADPFADDATHDLDDLIGRVDVVSLHAAVTPDTVGLMSEARFAAMRPGAVYVNSARAALHDLDAFDRRARLRAPGGRRARPLRGRAPPGRPPAGGHGQRGPHPPHRRRHLRHRGQPHRRDGCRPGRRAPG